MLYGEGFQLKDLSREWITRFKEKRGGVPLRSRPCVTRVIEELEWGLHFPIFAGGTWIARFLSQGGE